LVVPNTAFTMDFVHLAHSSVKITNWTPLAPSLSSMALSQFLAALSSFSPPTARDRGCRRAPHHPHHAPDSGHGQLEPCPSMDVCHQQQWHCTLSMLETRRRACWRWRRLTHRLHGVLYPIDSFWIGSATRDRLCFARTFARRYQ
jgi:hypothetical protein